MIRPYALILAGAVAAVLPQAARAHAALAAATPSADSVTHGVPTAVELTFSEAIEPKFSQIVVKGADGRRVDGNDPHAVSDDKHLTVSLKGVLLPGVYRVSWKVTAVDTHKSNGGYAFTVGQ